MRRDETAAVAAASALFAEEDSEETTETVAEQVTTEEVEAPQETEEEDLFPNFEVELPEDLEEELEAPTAQQIREELEQDEDYQLLDEDSQKLLARARAAEKKAEFYETLRTKDARKGWEAEAKKFFPLSVHALDSISADSRRGFLRKAKAAHEAVVPYVKEIQGRAEAAIEKEKEKAKATARTEAEEAWGKPAKSTNTPTEATITQEELARNRSRGDFASTVKAMIFPKKGEE